MNDQPKEASEFSLWHRRSSREPWRAVASAPSEGELTQHLAKLPSGDVISLPSGKHPNDRRGKK
jgi:hypothetical protein